MQTAAKAHALRVSLARPTWTATQALPVSPVAQATFLLQKQRLAQRVQQAISTMMLMRLLHATLPTFICVRPVRLRALALQSVFPAPLAWPTWTLTRPRSAKHVLLVTRQLQGRCRVQPALRAWPTWTRMHQQHAHLACLDISLRKQLCPARHVLAERQISIPIRLPHVHTVLQDPLHQLAALVAMCAWLGLQT